MATAAKPLFAFDNSYERDLEGLYEPWQPAAVPAPRLLALVRSPLLAVGRFVAPLFFGLVCAPGRIEQRGHQHVLDRDRPAHALAAAISACRTPQRRKASRPSVDRVAYAGGIEQTGMDSDMAGYIGTKRSI